MKKIYRQTTTSKIDRFIVIEYLGNIIRILSIDELNPDVIPRKINQRPRKAESRYISGITFWQYYDPFDVTRCYILRRR